MQGIRLLMQHPGILNLDCQECEKWHYKIPAGTKIFQGGRSIPRGTPGRPGYTPPPCFKCPKIRPDFDEARERLFDQNGRSIIKNKTGLQVLSEKNEICYQFHLEREIFGYADFEKEDGWVRDNAVTIKMVERSIDKEDMILGMAEIIAALYGAK